MNKTCSLCQKRPAAEGFKRCDDCRSSWAATARRRRARDPEKDRQYQRTRNRERRLRALHHYGGVCACCGEDRYEFLVLDHADGGGTQHRAEVGRGSQMVDWIIAHDFPAIFRVLCHNCNGALGHYGYCPHEGLRAVAGDE